MDGAILYNVTREDLSHQMNLEEKLQSACAREFQAEGKVLQRCGCHVGETKETSE